MSESEMLRDVYRNLSNSGALYAAHLIDRVATWSRSRSSVRVKAALKTYLRRKGVASYIYERGKDPITVALETIEEWQREN